MDIKEILSEVGVEIPEDKANDFNSSFRKSYKSVAEVGKISSARDTYKSDYESLKADYDSKINEYNTIKTTADDYKTKYESVNQELTGLKTVGDVKGAGVDDKFVKFVTQEVNGLVNDKTDFQTALKTYVEENPQYLKGTKVKTNSSFSMSGEPSKADSSNETMNAKILNAFGRK